MGYTHDWAYAPDDPSWQAAWPRLVQDAGRIADHVGVQLADGLGEEGSQPEFGPERIWLNGVEDDGHETFGLSRNPSGRYKDTDFDWSFCKTGAMPYDTVVGAILLRAVQLAPDAIVVTSSGAWDDEWLLGATEGDGPSIRDTVRELFGTDEVRGSSGDPFSSRTTDGPPCVRGESRA